MDLSQILTLFVTTVGSLAGAGPYGLIALGGSGLAGVMGLYWLVKKFNAKTDSADMERAGKDAGNTATELRNQTEKVNDKLDSVGNNNPAD